jgi:hypothetical protein
MFRNVYIELVNGFKEISLEYLIPSCEDLQSYYSGVYGTSEYSLRLMRLRFKNLNFTSL